MPRRPITIQHIILDCSDLQIVRINTPSIPDNSEGALIEDDTMHILTKNNVVNNY